MRCGNDVGFVFFGEGFSRETAAQFVDALVIGQRATDSDFGEDFHALNFQHFKLYATVVEQQDIARDDVSRQSFIINTDFFFVAFAFTEVGV